MAKTNAPTRKPIAIAKPVASEVAAPMVSLEDILKGYTEKEVKAALSTIAAKASRSDWAKYIKENIDKLDDRTIKTIYSNVRRCVDPSYKPRYQPKAK
jgi:intergrase/recombinase